MSQSKKYKLAIYSYFGETTIGIELTNSEAELLNDIHESIERQNGENNLSIELTK